MEAAVGRVEDLVPAGWTGCGIGDDTRVDRGRLAGADLEADHAWGCAVRWHPFHGVDAGQWRALCAQLITQAIQCLRRSPGADQYPLAIVDHDFC